MPRAAPCNLTSTQLGTYSKKLTTEQDWIQFRINRLTNRNKIELKWTDQLGLIRPPLQSASTHFVQYFEYQRNLLWIEESLGHERQAGLCIPLQFIVAVVVLYRSNLYTCRYRKGKKKTTLSKTEWRCANYMWCTVFFNEHNIVQNTVVITIWYLQVKCTPLIADIFFIALITFVNVAYQKSLLWLNLAYSYAQLELIFF